MKSAGSLMDQASAAVALLPGTQAHSTLHALMEMAGMFVSAAAMKKLSIPEALGALKGRHPAPPMMLKVAQFILKVRDNPLALDTLKSIVNGALAAKGIAPEAFLGLLQKVAPLVEVSSPATTDEAYEVLSTLAQRLVSAEENEVYVPSAICVCPKCRHVFGVRSEA